MQGPAAKLLRSLFDEQMRRECAAFEKAPLQPFPGDVVYCRHLPQGVAAFVLLAIAPRDDRFTLEVAWSADGQFPVDMFCRLPFGVPNKQVLPEQPVGGKMRFRISEFWNPGRDDWWYLDGERPTLQESMKTLMETNWENYKPPTFSTEKVDSAVQKAITAIRELVIPYFEALEV